MRKPIVRATAVVLLVSASAFAQSEAELKKHFEGMAVVAEFDLAAGPKGLDIEAGRTGAKRKANITKYSILREKSGTAVSQGQPAWISQVRVIEKRIEVYVNSGRPGTPSTPARINLRYPGPVPPQALTPHALMATLVRVIRFPGQEEALLAAATYGALRPGMKKSEVRTLIGRSSVCSETRDGASTTLVCNYNLPTVLVKARFVNDVLKSFETTPR